MAESFSGQPMDEVLASIRRIITEDGAPAMAPRAVAPDDDVLELGGPAAEPDALVSQIATAASQKALAQLSGIAIDPRAPENSLDGLVREMLRPMLKTWLDANLPDLVERIVAREIARIGRN